MSVDSSGVVTLHLLIELDPSDVSASHLEGLPLLQPERAVSAASNSGHHRDVAWIVDPADAVWARLAKEEERLQREISDAPDRKTRRALKGELKHARRHALGEAVRARTPPTTHWPLEDAAVSALLAVVRGGDLLKHLLAARE